MTRMQEVGESIVRSFDARQKRLKELRVETSQVLKTAPRLLKGFREAQSALREELSGAKDAWQKAATTLQKKRHQRSK